MVFTIKIGSNVEKKIIEKNDYRHVLKRLVNPEMGGLREK